MRHRTFRRRVFLAFLAMILVFAQGAAAVPCDVNEDGLANAIDVQIVIAAILGNSTSPLAQVDVDKNGMVDALDLQMVINELLGRGAQPLEGLERFLAAHYVMRPGSLDGGQDEFTILQLLLNSYAYADFLSPKRYAAGKAAYAPTASGKSAATPVARLDNARKVAKRILSSTDPVGEANRILGLGLPEDVVAVFRPHARTPLNRQATLEAFRHQFFWSLLAKSQPPEKTDDDDWYDPDWEAPYWAGEAYEETARFIYEYLPSYDEGDDDESIMDMFDRFIRSANDIAAENAWKMAQDMYDSFEFGAGYVMDYISTIPNNLRDTLYGYSLEDRIEAVKAVARHMGETLNLTEEVGSEFGKHMRRGAENLALIDYESDWVDNNFRQNYRNHVDNGVPLDSMDFSDFPNLTYTTPIPQIEFWPSPYHVADGDDSGDGDGDGTGDGDGDYGVTITASVSSAIDLWPDLYPCVCNLYVSESGRYRLLGSETFTGMAGESGIFRYESDLSFSPGVAFRLECSSPLIYFVSAHVYRHDDRMGVFTEDLYLGDYLSAFSFTLSW